MRKHQEFHRIRHTAAAALLALAVWTVASPAQAQSSDEGERQQVRARIERALDGDASLDNALREQMRARLEECVESGLSTSEIEGLFGPKGPNADVDPQARLRTQTRVLAMHREGLPTDLVVEKFQEGAIKGVPEARLEQAMARVETQVRTMSQWMHQLQSDGVAWPAQEQVQTQLRRGMTLDLWRGGEEGDLDQLRTRAQQRLKDGSCSMTDVAAALETMTQLRECGVDRERSRDLAGEALQQGYTAREIRQIGWMAQAAHANGEDGAAVMAQFQRGMQSPSHFQEMVREMMQSGWMGPGDQRQGQSGNRPVDDVLGGGPGDGRGQGGNGSGSGNRSGGGGSGN